MNTEKKIRTIMKKLDEFSFMEAENKKLLKKYIEEAVDKNIPITFFNWECPPRFLDITKDNKTFVNYNLDLDDIFNMKKYDDYTEFPRCLEEFDREKEIFNFLNSFKIPYRFIKIIADTNALYLNKKSIDILGKKLVDNKFLEFKKKIKKQLKKYPITSTEVYLFTELFGESMDTYNKIFVEEYGKLKNNKSSVPQEIIEEQLQRTRDHMGMTKDSEINDFTYRTIASYGAEGIIFNEWSKRDTFRNPVWLNIEEANERTKSITNFVRNDSDIENLPMVFLK